ncbi:MAG: hypothetical protein GY828_00765 [Candidatus Gracilibacteria bacterium]|nr:hypothetical protein [Candidatus Gracilibacteria bacterium]
MANLNNSARKYMEAMTEKFVEKGNQIEALGVIQDKVRDNVVYLTPKESGNKKINETEATVTRIF